GGGGRVQPHQPVAVAYPRCRRGLRLRRGPAQAAATAFPGGAQTPRGGLVQEPPPGPGFLSRRPVASGRPVLTTRAIGRKIGSCCAPCRLLVDSPGQPAAQSPHFVDNVWKLVCVRV